MREYKIVKIERGWIISRKKEMWRLMILQYLNWKWLRSPHKTFAKVYYDRDSVAEALVVIKSKWRLETSWEYHDEQTEKRENKEKQSWSEL